ncbi:hypothetical protein [Corynebacterium terpenotabidum]|uniref:hypothetical protein n=1 Tax=Corynebacterium terpenotabidum TaxID=89154 RepID=UPI0004096682|nr:hypothetical protein [Corynebacterium terpenotabidum]
MFEFLKRRTPRHVQICEAAQQRVEEREQYERDAPPPSFIQQHLDAQHDRTARLRWRQ